MKYITRSMSCPACGCKKTKVIDSRNTGAYIRRRRNCKNCQVRFTTTEVVLVDKDNTLPTEHDLFRHFIRAASDWMLADEVYKRMTTRQHEFGSSLTLRDPNESENKERNEESNSQKSTTYPQDNFRGIEEDVLRAHEIVEDKATEE